MSNQQSMRKCAHEGCMCEVSAGQTYCGPFCATAAAEAEFTHEHGRCQCGHAACAGAHPGAFSRDVPIN